MARSIANLDDLVKELFYYQEHWMRIGFELGVGAQDAIDIDKDNKPGHRMTRMFQFLLEKKPIYWEDVVKALRSKNVNLAELADELEAKYCKGAKRPHSEEETDAPATKKIEGASPGAPIYPIYPMTQQAHGNALIINNHTFNGPNRDRHGTNTDRDVMKRALENLGYTVTVENNVSAADINDLVIQQATNAPDSCDSFICCIFTHGGAGSVKGSDWRDVNIRDIVKALAEVDKLKGKPKIFFIQACRGTDKPRIDTAAGPEEEEETPEEDSVGLKLPRDSDFFYGYATTPETVSIRMSESGSWYIQELSKVLQANYGSDDLVTMVTKVHQGVATKPKYKCDLYETNDQPPKITVEKTSKRHGTYRQQPQLVSSLRGPVYFCGQS